MHGWDADSVGWVEQAEWIYVSLGNYAYTWYVHTDVPGTRYLILLLPYTYNRTVSVHFSPHTRYVHVI